MKVSQSFIAAALVVALPLSVLAGDKDKTAAPMGTTASAQFANLDTNGDKRISQMEASSDAKINFSTADKNGDGFIDASEFVHRDMSTETMPAPGNPASDTDQPRK
jgi:hypothetical protein